MLVSPFLIAQFIPVLSASVKGVAPQDQHLYTPDADGLFACLTDPSIRIPFDRVNDDYCDCPDGSDEPGTSACSNGHFWCVGSEQYVPSRIVADGVCDYELCCDGSDEAPGVCADRCAEVKAAQAARREAELNYLRVGMELREELLQRAALRKRELHALVLDFTNKIHKTESELTQAHADLEAAQIEDAKSSSDPESVEAIGELREALEFAESDLVEVGERFALLGDAYKVLDKALSQMADDYNPNFNDPAVKEAIKVWKAQAKPDSRLPSARRDYLSDRNLLDKIKVASTGDRSAGSGSFWRKLLPPIVTERLPSLQETASAGVRVQRVEAKIAGLQHELDELRQSLKTNENFLKVGESFWGPGEIGHGDEETCVSVQRGDFDYEVCFFGNAAQLDGRHRVELGHSTGLKQDGAGQLTIEFVGGNDCPNKVKRSLTLYLECGHKDEALFVEEPEMCHYVVKAKSPMACNFPELNADSEVEHDEL